MFFQQGIKNIRTSEVRLPQPANCLCEVHQTVARREFQNAQRPGDTEPFSTCGRHAFAVVHQQQVGIERGGQVDRRSFSSSIPFSSGSLSKSLDVSRTSTHAGSSATQFRTDEGVLLAVNSACTAEGKITFSNKAGRRSMCPIRIKYLWARYRL
jgi:hypothetical protein